MIDDYRLQDFLFEQGPSRMDLMNYKKASGGAKFRVAVYRNHSFELIENTISAYLDYAEIDLEFVYSDYDDSLSFTDLDLSVDLILLWVDLDRYSADDIDSFINERINHLRTVFDKNILFVPVGSISSLSADHVAMYDLSTMKKELGEDFFDERMEKFSGTRLSRSACMCIAKDLGLNWLTALLKPLLKCIVVDLDNTLYQGVLGEDGEANLVLKDGHVKLQEKLLDLKNKGFFLCVASKNDDRDVMALFSNRDDFPLSTENFTIISANWGAKADSIAEMSKQLNIHVDSFLFIDDNMGELVSVRGIFPEIKSIWAKDDPDVTCRALSNFPGLLKLNANAEDAIRNTDVVANQKRQALLSSASKEDYLKSLEVNLMFSINNFDQLDRVTELSNKTNQFILSYKRYSPKTVQSLMETNNSAVVTVSLSDKLSDSGIIGVAVLIKQDNHALLEEAFVSCRALGRGLDAAIVKGAVLKGLQHLGLSQLQVQFTEGERNLPALTYVNENFSLYIERPEMFNYDFPLDLITVSVI